MIQKFEDFNRPIRKYIKLNKSMNAEYFEQLINGMQNQETTNEANSALSNFICDPQSILFLFQMIEDPPSEKIKHHAIIFLNTYMKKNYDSLDQQFQNDIFNKLVHLTFSEEPTYSELLYPILCDCANDDVTKSVNLLPIIDTCFTSNSSIVTAMEVLSEIITNFGKDTSVIISNHEKFINYSFLGLQSNNWDIIISSMLVFFYTKFVIQTEPIEPHFDIIVNLGKDPNLYLQETSFGKYWSIIGDAISKNIIPIAKIGELYDFIVAFSSNEAIPNYSRIIPLRSLVGAVEILDFERFSQVLNLVFILAISYVDQENSIPVEYFDLIRRSLTTLPMKEVYMMLKERIVHLLSLNSRGAHVVSIVIYSLIFEITPDVAFSDIDSIISNLMSALDKNDELLSTAVCIVLITFQDSFLSVDVYALQFLPRIVPFIISPNNELRQKANHALTTLCRIITVPVPNFYEALWATRDQIPRDEFDYYLDYLAFSIEKNEGLEDSKTVELLNFILPFLANENDIETASIFLNLVVTLVTFNEALIEMLLLPSLNVIIICLTKIETIESSLINCFDFISKMYEAFGDKFNVQFQPVVQATIKLLFTWENDNEEDQEIEDGSNVSNQVRLAALDACCTVAQATSDRDLAFRLQEICVKFFTRDYEKEVMENGDNEEEDEGDVDELIEDIELDSITEGSKGCCKIIKLLNNEDARQLFYNIYEYIIGTPYPRGASEAMKPIRKLLHNSSEEERPFYLNKCYDILDQIMKSTFKALEGKQIFSGQVDLFLMTNIAYLISEVVRYPSQLIEALCDFMINIIQSSADSAYLYSFIGAYSDVIKFKTGSPQAVQSILKLVPQLLQNAKDPNTKHNLSYLLILLVQNDPQSLQNVLQFVPILQEWYVQGKQAPNGHRIMLANIASAFLTFFANGMPLDFTLLNEAIDEFPPYDTHETSPMIQNMATIFFQNQVDESCIDLAEVSLFKFFTLSDIDLKKRKVPPELMNTAHEMFIMFSKSRPQIIQTIIANNQNSPAKLAKLDALLQV